MRIDLLLKYLCIAKSRTQAKKLCEEGLVVVNGRIARPATEAMIGDRIEIDLRRRRLGLELVQLPERQASKASASRFYTLLFETERGEEIT